MYGQHWQRRELTPDLANFRRDGSTTGLDGNSQVRSGEIASGNPEPFYRLLCAVIGKDYIQEHYESGVGNPNTVECDGLKLTQSDLLAVYARWRLESYVPEQPDHIVEIGAGYGATVAHLRRLYPTAEITIVDLPEHREFQEYYLSETVGLNGIYVTTELPDTADMVIAHRCLMEMPDGEVSKYFSWLQRLPMGTFFYLINRHYKYNIMKLYPWDYRWAILYSYPMFGQPRLHEFLLRRTREENRYFVLALDTLPPYVIGDRIVDQGNALYDVTNTQEDLSKL